MLTDNRYNRDYNALLELQLGVEWATESSR